MWVDACLRANDVVLRTPCTCASLHLERLIPTPFYLFSRFFSLTRTTRGLPISRYRGRCRSLRQERTTTRALLETTKVRLRDTTTGYTQI